VKVVDFWGFDFLVQDDVTYIAMDGNRPDVLDSDDPTLKFGIWTFTSENPPVWDKGWKMWCRVGGVTLPIQRLIISGDVVEEIKKKTKPKHSLVYCGV
jgi:hypothetical protein